MYHHLNTLTIFPERLQHNLDVLSRLLLGVQAVPVVKSNAYGHGIKIVAPFLQKYDAPFVCVDSLYEAYELEKNGYKRDILIMGYVDPRDIPRRKSFIYAVSDLDHGIALKREYSRIRLHLFLDTGMHREGLILKSGEEKMLQLVPHIEGVMSHLSTPENAGVTDDQLALFHDAIEQLKILRINPKYTHISASGGLIHTHIHMKRHLGNIARTGLAYYGYGHSDLLPALRCSTCLIQIKNIQAGECIGYDRTYCAEKDMKIGVLPIGYHDGMDRRFSNIGFVQLHGELCPIVGRVSMNLTTIDMTHIPDAIVGDEVIVIDENPYSKVSLMLQSERAGMIPYDMLVHMNKEMYRTIA